MFAVWCCAVTVPSGGGSVVCPNATERPVRPCTRPKRSFLVLFLIHMHVFNRYESVIHEFDPYFNFRTTKVKPFWSFMCLSLDSRLFVGDEWRLLTRRVRRSGAIN